jgi:hypothetical protein
MKISSPLALDSATNPTAFVCSKLRLLQAGLALKVD